VNERSDKPPRGYMPFLVEYQCECRWACATPHCDSAEDLVYEVEDDETFERIDILEWRGEIHDQRERILRLFETREGAVEACWNHARRWWDGEPPAVPGIPDYDVLPDGYAIFVEVEQRRVWLRYPDGNTWGGVQRDQPVLGPPLLRGRRPSPRRESPR